MENKRNFVIGDPANYKMENKRNFVIGDPANYMRILVVGGTGYIGTPLVKKLILNNCEITLMVRSEGDFRDEFKGCKHFVADLLDKKSLVENIKGFDVVVNLAAIIRTLDKKKYGENVEGMKNLIEVLKEKGIENILYFSTQNVSLKEKGPYAKSKEASEGLLLKSGLQYVIVRPNYVYGIDKNNDFWRLNSLIRKFGLAPVIGTGDCKFQPVFKDDLVNIVAGLINSFKPKAIVEISGPETVSINEVVSFLSENSTRKPFKIHIPVFPLKVFKFLIPFDVDGYTESRISKNPFSDYRFSSFKENLKEIIKKSNE